ncbi:glycosyltransferase family 39 protein [bacterium]|nr:glycosyltransferase family 39 protein [bacterium]
MARNNRRGFILPMWLIVLLAVFFRLFLLRYRFAISFDEAHYARMAAGFLADGWQKLFHPYWSPGFPLCASPFIILIPDVELACRICNILMGALTIPPLYYFATGLFDERTARLAGLFVALYPPIAFSNTSVYAETNFVFWGIWGLWFGWRFLQEGKWISLPFSGLFFGFSYLAKPEGFSFLLFYALFAASLIVARLARGGKKILCLAVIPLLAGFFTSASPYLLFLRHEAGFWTLSAKSLAYRQWHNTFFTPEDDDVFHDLDREDKIFLNDAILHEGNFLRLNRLHQSTAPVSMALQAKKYITYLFRTLKYELPATLTFPCILLFALGLFGSAWKKEAVPLFLFLLGFLFFFWLAVIPMFVLTERYLLSMMPLAMIWMGKGWVCIEQWIGATFGRPFRRMKLLTVAVGLCFAMGTVGAETAKIVQRRPDSADEWDDPVELKKAGQWLKDRAKRPVILMSLNKAVDFYAGNDDIRNGFGYPNEDTRRILNYARNKNVQYFTVEERYFKQFPQQVQSWVSGSMPEELECVLHLPGPGSTDVWILTWKNGASPSG